MPKAVIRFASSVMRTGLFGQPCFPKTLNKQLRVWLPAPGDMRRYCKGGIDLKHTRRRVVRLSVTSEMGEGGREAAVSCQIAVLTKGFIQSPRGVRVLIPATPLSEGPQSTASRLIARPARSMQIL